MKSNPRNKLRYFLELSKLKIMVPVSLTGFTGYFLYDPHFSLKIVLLSVGVLLQAVAASVLNQIQEAAIDSRMNRTHNRPIPAHRITIRQALILFIIALITGTVIIFLAGNLLASLIGLLTILWYNGIYTYAKRITAFAVIPGAVTGALPPLIGWVAAGGGIWDKTIIFVEFLLFIGQVPHFWLLILKYGEEYEKAGIPSLTSIFSRAQIKRITFTWVVVSAIAALFLCHFEIIQTRIIMAILILSSLVMVWKFSDLFKGQADISGYKRLIFLFESYFLLILLLLISDRIIS